jgi:alpha-1,2-glucosyltransferase
MRIRLLWAGFAFLYLLAALYSSAAPLIDDEFVHYGQIDRFDHGDFRLFSDYLTTIPGYHVLSAGVLWALHARTVAAARLLNAVFGLFAIAAFHRLRSLATGKDESAATLQFALLPLLFPYDFLVYTDVLSLALVLASAAATLSRRYWIAGLLLTVSLTVRQVNVVWAVLLAGMAFWERPEAERKTNWQSVRTLWPYAFCVGLFLAFWLWNGSISLSKPQTEYHPDLSFHTGNLFFALFLIAILLPFQMAQGLAGAAREVPARLWPWLVPCVAALIYWYSFSIDNPFNNLHHSFFLHNYILQNSQTTLGRKIGFGLIAVLPLAALPALRLRPASAALLYPVAAFSLCAAWMIHPRYALVPIALWLAFRQTGRDEAERLTTFYWGVLSFCVWFGVIKGYFVF